ncbi:DUF3040 domain-containing protein [Streptomyces sp. NPDC050400]|uniref:DUF3040 domain-containing protein n=1 Tax=Streptomyces sp. NPDC050400 TaxID=3365610 RepID=UPI00378CC797
MPTSDDTRLTAIAERLEAEDPRFAAGLRQGRPRPPREYDHRLAWTAVTLGLVALGVGVVTSHGMVIAAALVATGAACHLFDRPR